MLGLPFEWPLKTGFTVVSSKTLLVQTGSQEKVKVGDYIVVLFIVSIVK